MRSTRCIHAGVTRLESSRRRWRSNRTTGYLLEQLVEGVLAAPVTGSRITPFGTLYEVVVLVDGLNGATMPVATIWIVESDLPPRLVASGQAARAAS